MEFYLVVLQSGYRFSGVLGLPYRLASLLILHIRHESSRTGSLPDRDDRECTSHEKTTAQNEVALSYHRVHGLYFLAVVFMAIIVILMYKTAQNKFNKTQ